MPRKTKQPINLDFLQGNDARTDLSGLFAASVSDAADVQQAISVPIDRLLNNPYQPRMDANDDALGELAQVIGSQGFQGVLVARPDPANPGFYQITAGHRRREAARRAGLSTLPVVVRDFTNEEMATIAITENIQREDLTPLEEGKIFLLMAEEMGYTHEQVAREIGRKRGYVENRIRVARAPIDVQALVSVKPDSIRAVATLIKVKDEADRLEMINGLLAGKLTVEDLPGYIEARNAARETETIVREANKILVEAGLPEIKPSKYAPADRGPKERETQPLPSTSTSTSTTSEATQAAFDTTPPTPQPAPNTLSMSPEERSSIRVGSAKLAAAYRYLSTYRQQAETRESLSRQERATLGNIKLLVDALYEQFVAPESAGDPPSQERLSA
jgi:ParB family chromosome partitioning protein